MQANVRGFVVGILGLAVLLAVPAVSLARPKNWGPGSTMCLCSCEAENGGNVLSWQKVATCAVNGRACKYTPHEGGDLVNGTLRACQECKVDAGGSNCVFVRYGPGGIGVPPSGGIKQPPAPVPPGRVKPPASTQ